MTFPLALLAVIFGRPLLETPAIEHTLFPEPFLHISTVLLVLPVPFPETPAPLTYVLTPAGPELLTESLPLVLLHESLQMVPI